MGLTGDGGLLPAPDALRGNLLPSRVWTYPPQQRASCAAEVLPPSLTEGLLATYMPPGSHVVDVKAGTGTIDKPARPLGVWSRSGDLHQCAPSLHVADARTLLVAGEGLGGPRPAAGSAEAFVLDPSTLPSLVRRPLEALRPRATFDAYADEVGALVLGGIDVLTAGGVVILMKRPGRTGRQVSGMTSHLPQALTDSTLTLEGHHLAVAQDSSEDWHALVARHLQLER